MASKRGGKRPGAGRPQGATARATKSMRATLTEIAREHTEVAIKALVEVAKKSESDSARVAAANAILDRGYGRPSQAHQHTGAHGGPIQTVDLTSLSNDQLASLKSIFGSLAGSGDDDAVDPGGRGAAGISG